MKLTIDTGWNHRTATVIIGMGQASRAIAVQNNLYAHNVEP